MSETQEQRGVRSPTVIDRKFPLGMEWSLGTDLPDPTPLERLEKLQGKLSWEVIPIIEDFLLDLASKGPHERTETALILWKIRLRQLERLSDRTQMTLEYRELYGHRNPRRDTRRSRHSAAAARSGPQTLEELVLQTCGTQSHEWKQFVRLKELFGVPKKDAEDTPSY